jgi:DNA-binding response OmpR family regulator
MTPRSQNDHTEPCEHPARDHPQPRDASKPRILFVTADSSLANTLATRLAGAGGGCSVIARASAAREKLGEYDVVLVDARLSDLPPLDLVGAAADAGASPILVGDLGSVQEVVAAVRAGAADILSPSAPGMMGERVMAAAAKSSRARRQGGRIDKLQRLCRGLNGAREQVARQAESLCVDLCGAYQELADHMNQVTTATEFKGLIQSELDIESLLRTTLEYVLARSGPTNAAIFLPTTSGDYSLGAYVNYDCPKDTVDILLDHLANVVAPRFEDLPNLLHLPEQAGLDRYIGDDAQWLDGSGVVALACRHEGETLAIFMLFRDRRNRYGAPLLEQVKTIGGLFAAQLARVIHIHHRHLPKDKWGMMGDPEHGADGYGDLAA